MSSLPLSSRFLDFLQNYARTSGKAPERIVEEAVSQAILRHSSPDEPSPRDASLLMPGPLRQRLLDLLIDFDHKTETDSPFGVLLERLPDKNWHYQVCKLDEYWFMVVSDQPTDLPPLIDVKSVEVSQAYCWIFGYTKTVKLWSSPSRFLIVF